MTFRTSEFQRGAECSEKKYFSSNFFFFVNLLNITLSLLRLMLQNRERGRETERKEEEGDEEERKEGRKKGRKIKGKGREEKSIPLKCVL